MTPMGSPVLPQEPPHLWGVNGYDPPYTSTRKRTPVPILKGKLLYYVLSQQFNSFLFAFVVCIQVSGFTYSDGFHGPLMSCGWPV